MFGKRFWKYGDLPIWQEIHFHSAQKQFESEHVCQGTVENLKKMRQKNGSKYGGLYEPFYIPKNTFSLLYDYR